MNPVDRDAASVVAFVLEGRPDEAENLIALMGEDELRGAVLAAGKLVSGIAVGIVDKLHRDANRPVPAPEAIAADLARVVRRKVNSEGDGDV